MSNSKGGKGIAGNKVGAAKTATGGFNKGRLNAMANRKGATAGSVRNMNTMLKQAGSKIRISKTKGGFFKAN